MSKELFEPDEVIFKQGDRSEVAYVIESGRVEIFDASADNSLQIAVLGPGEIFGEMSLVDEMPRSHSARAVESVVARRMSQNDFVTLLREDPDESLRYIRVLFERLRTMNERSKSSPRETHTQAMDSSFTLRLMAEDGNARSCLPDGELVVRQFPFKVGRKSKSSLSKNDLTIQDQKPYSISRDHFSFDRQGDRIVVRDRGSYLGLRVNDHHIGGDRKQAAMALEIGENTLVLGESTKAFRFRVVVEAQALV